MKIESGTRGLNSLELARLASALDRPIQWFVSESPPTVVSRRAAKLQAPDDVDALVDGFSRDVELLIELKALKPPALAERRLPETLAEAEQLAQAARSDSEQPDGPLTNLNATVEQLGLYVFAANLPRELADGAYVALEHAGATVINGSQDAGRRRFTLAHELGHHVMGDEYSTDWAVAESRDARERQVNAFAVHFLMPRRSVVRDWGAFGGEHEPRRATIGLAAEYRVSWSAACTQVQSIGLVDGDLADALRSRPPTRVDFLENGVFVVEELAPPLLSPEFTRAVLRAYRGQKIGPGRAVEALRNTITEEELPPIDEVPLESLRGELESSV